LDSLKLTEALKDPGIASLPSNFSSIMHPSKSVGG
jgi:hypothetical protein